jgi:N-acetylmuramoyl-L-alanine amidase
MELINNKLSGTNIEYIPTPNLYNPPEFTEKNLPDTIVIHFTAMNTLQGAVKALITHKDKDNVSAHLVIGKKGEIVQLAPFNYRTFHAGKSSYKGRNNYNQYSIGIEIDNLGWLIKYDNFYSRPELLPYNIKVYDNDVLMQFHKNKNYHPYQYWQKYTAEQLEAVLLICRLLKENYPIKEIVGHDDIAPERKPDPGPAFPMQWLINEIFYPGREDDIEDEKNIYEAKVNVEKLNIRSSPSEDAPKIALPLNKDQKIKVIEKSGDWIKVKTEIEGWVFGKYIDKI